MANGMATQGDAARRKERLDGDGAGGSKGGMSEEHDYLLGTHGEEVERLGLQHRVWRPRMLEGWRRAGITEGWTVIDAGAGPGWAAFDLAEMVGPRGRVHALERSQRFFAHLSEQTAARRLAQVSPTELDLVTDPLLVREADAFWIRWVLAFVEDPGAVLAKLTAALRPAGSRSSTSTWTGACSGCCRRFPRTGSSSTSCWPTGGRAAGSRISDGSCRRSAPGRACASGRRGRWPR